MTAAEPREEMPPPASLRPTDDLSREWTTRPSGRSLARVWITVVFAILTVAGVTAVFVAGFREGQNDLENAQLTEVASDGVFFSGRALFAFEDERAAAAMWRADPTAEARNRYSVAIEQSDEALEMLRLGWLVRRQTIDEVGPPTLADLETALTALPELRQASFDISEGSTVVAYSGIVDLVMAMTSALDSLAADSALTSQIRSSVRLLQAGEAMARQRDLVIDMLAEGEDPTQEELVQLSLLDQEIRSTLVAARALAPSENRDAIGDFVADRASGGVREMLNTFLDGEMIDVEEWWQVTSARLAALRVLAEGSASSLVQESDADRAAVARRNTQRVIGLSALWLVSVIAGLAAVGAARERARALHEHDALAAGLFEWFLPASLPEVAGVTIAARFDPASRFALAGGDWYDAYLTPDGVLAMTIGDVAGHGPNATAQMAQVRYLLRGITLASGGTPASQVRQLDTAVRGSSTMATIFHAHLDVERGELIYTRAGHVAGMLRQGAQVTELDGALGPPVGAGSESAFVDAVVSLSAPTDIVLFTDGLVEDRFGDLEDRLAALASALSAAGDDLGQVADELIRARPDRSDDAALIVLGWDAPGSRVG